MLTWKTKKMVIFLFSVVGTMSNREYWKDLFVSEKFIEKAQKISDDTAELASMLQLKGKDYDILAQDIKKGIYTVEVFHNQEIQEKNRQVRKLPIKIQKEYLDDLVGIACMNCLDCKRNVKACDQRKLFRKIGIEAVDPERTDSKCEYWYMMNTVGGKEMEVLSNG
jgi:hypothetical protein